MCEGHLVFLPASGNVDGLEVLCKTDVALDINANGLNIKYTTVSDTDKQEHQHKLL